MIPGFLALLLDYIQWREDKPECIPLHISPLVYLLLPYTYRSKAELVPANEYEIQSGYKSKAHYRRRFYYGYSAGALLIKHV